MRSAQLLSHEERFEHELTWLALKNTIRGPTLSEKDRHLCMRLERLWRDTCHSRPQFPQSTHGTPGTMTPLLARKTVAFYDSGFPTEARVKIPSHANKTGSLLSLNNNFQNFHKQPRLL